MRNKSVQWLLPLGTGFFALTLFMTGCSNDKGSPLVNVTLLQTTDMHDAASGVGSFNAYTPMDTTDNDTVTGGWARLAEKINEIRTAKEANGDTVLLVDSGDYTMGTVYDMLWNVDPAPFRFLNNMNYDLITLGNHEFDYGPKKLATMINTARAATGGFTVPIIATNTVFSGTDTGDDDLEALNAAQIIITDSYVKSYSNGLKIGVIGIMGKSSDTDSPNALPVTFKSDYADETVKSFIQGKVDALRNTKGVDVVIALSHSGITDPNNEQTRAGDDITLAENVTGIDIIASGHEHEMTDNVVTVVNGDHSSYIICAGANGTNLAQLDFVVDKKTKTLTAAPVLTNHAITDAIAGDGQINTLVQGMNTSINTILTPFSINLSDIVATSGLDLGFPSSVQEFGLGNLLADAVRYVGTDKDAQTPTIGAFANGVIRGAFKQGQEISFADLFAVVPLGITTDDTQDPLLPGYPLLKVYLDGNGLWDLCKFDVTIMQPFAAAYAAYYSSLSGLECTYTTGTTNITAVRAYAWDDYKCTGTGPMTAIAPDTSPLYPVIIDKYTMDMLLTADIQDLLGLLGISNLHPKLVDGTVIDDNTKLMSARLDRVAGAPIQEYSAWSAALKFFSDSGWSTTTIPTVPYDLTIKRMIAQ